MHSARLGSCRKVPQSGWGDEGVTGSTTRKYYSCISKVGRGLQGSASETETEEILRENDEVKALNLPIQNTHASTFPGNSHLSALIIDLQGFLVATPQVRKDIGVLNYLCLIYPPRNECPKFAFRYKDRQKIGSSKQAYTPLVSPSTSCHLPNPGLLFRFSMTFIFERCPVSFGFLRGQSSSALPR